MKHGFAKTLAVAAGAASLALMSFAATSAGAAPVVRSAVPPGVTLHVQPASAVMHGTPKGLVRPRGYKVVNALGGGNLLYHGGPVQNNVKIYIIYWGFWWASGCTGQQGHGTADEAYLSNYFNGMGAPGDGLSAVQSQYGDSAGHHPTYPTTLGHTLAGTAAYCADPPAVATDAQLAGVASAYATFLTEHSTVVDRNTEIIVVSPSGTNPGGGFGSQYCAYHNVTTFNNALLSWTNLPYMPDQGGNCGANFLPTGPNPALQGWSIVGGHEFAESATDPFVNNQSAWFDNQGFEIGDKCAWTQIFVETTATGKYVQQPEWSNASSSCAQSGHISDTVSVQRGVNLSSVHGHAVTFQVYAHSSHGLALGYSASGLPAGLSINGNTGVISGTPTHIATYTVHVKAFDKTATYNNSTATFTWRDN